MKVFRSNRTSPEFLIGVGILLAGLVGAGCAGGDEAIPSEARAPVVCGEPRPEICTQDYRPVCAQRDNGVRCVTTPCDSTDSKTFSNGCTACSDRLVFTYVDGACVEDDVTRD